MNLLKIYPKKLRLKYEKDIKNSGVEDHPEKYFNSIFKIILVITALSLILFYFVNINSLYAIAVFIFLNILFYFRISLKAINRIKKMETIFPDVISLMASNLRAGITIERAFLLAARPEFDPLDTEILKTGKEITTGKDVVFALKEMSKRINSEKISKIVMLIITGLKAGGNVSDLLEHTSKNMKEKEVMEKKIASTTLMYVIFIFAAVSVGAPILFSLSSVLVEIVINLGERLPDVSNIQMELPFTFQSVPISVNFVIWFSLLFILITDFISCFVIGIVNKGEGKTGLKYFLPIATTSLILFFIVRNLVSKILVDALGAF